MACELSFVERRVLGVLIEKGYTTPDQYPLTLNALVAGCNQKSCRDPVVTIAEQEVVDALDTLREKRFAVVVRVVGSRTDRFKHRFHELYGLSPKQCSVVAELLLRGPQTDGEIRQRASRMAPIETLNELAEIIDGLRTREDSLVVRLGSEERRRGIKYAHTLYPAEERPDEHSESPATQYTPPPPTPARVAAPSAAPVATVPVSTGNPHPDAPLPVAGGSHGGNANADIGRLQTEIEKLRSRVEELEATFARFFR